MGLQFCKVYIFLNLQVRLCPVRGNFTGRAQLPCDPAFLTVTAPFPHHAVHLPKAGPGVASGHAPARLGRPALRRGGRDLERGTSPTGGVLARKVRSPSRHHNLAGVEGHRPPGRETQGQEPWSCVSGGHGIRGSDVAQEQPYKHMGKVVQELLHSQVPGHGRGEAGVLSIFWS